MSDNKQAVIISAARTATGKFQGSLKPFSATDLGSIAIREAEEGGLVPGRGAKNRCDRKWMVCWMEGNLFSRGCLRTFQFLLREAAPPDGQKINGSEHGAGDADGTNLTEAGEAGVVGKGERTEPGDGGPAAQPKCAPDAAANGADISAVTA